MEDLIVSRWTWEFPEVQWLRLSAFTSVAQVQSLVGELRSCKSHGAAKKKKNDRFVFKACGLLFWLTLELFY